MKKSYHSIPSSGGWSIQIINQNKKMKKITSVNIISMSNLTAIVTVIWMLIVTILSVLFGGLLGGMMGGGGAEVAGGGLVAGLISVVIALPVSWIAGIISALITNLALKVIGGFSIEMEG